MLPPESAVESAIVGVVVVHVHPLSVAGFVELKITFLSLSSTSESFSTPHLRVVISDSPLAARLSASSLCSSCSTSLRIAAVEWTFSLSRLKLLP